MERAQWLSRIAIPPSHRRFEVPVNPVADWIRAGRME